MTLNPYESPEVRGVLGPEYKVGPLCCNPSCKKFAEHAHHIFRRTDQRLGQPFEWVEIKGAVYQNLTGICPDCHHAVTSPVGGHKAAIKIVGPDFDWTWMWCIVKDKDTPVPVAPIRPQPLTPEGLALGRAMETSESDACPTCGHVKRARSSNGGRARASWTVKVPADAENGADILDVLVDDMALILGVEPNQTGRYYVLVPTLYYAHQEKSRFLESIKGVGG